MIKSYNQHFLFNLCQIDSTEHVVNVRLSEIVDEKRVSKKETLLIYSKNHHSFFV